MTLAERRSHLESLLDDLANQRPIDEDELRTELIHVLFELDDEVRQLRERTSQLESRVASAEDG